jgi:CRP-like cAMP-binding protein
VWCERNPQVQLMRVRKGALRIMAGVGALESPDKVKDVFGGSVLAPGTFFGAFDLVLGDVDFAKNGATVATAVPVADAGSALSAVAAVMGTSVDVVEFKYVQELFSRDPALARRFYSSMAVQLAEAVDATVPATPTPMPGHAADGSELEFAEIATNDDAVGVFCRRFDLPSEEFVLATYGAERRNKGGREPMPLHVTLYVTPLFLCIDGDLFGVHVTQRVPLDAVDEFDLDGDGRSFDLSWTEAVRDEAAASAGAADGSEQSSSKRKKKRVLRRNASLVLAESDADACVSLLRVVLKHASEQRSKHRKYATRGALLDELLLHHRQLAREEAHVPRDSAALSLRAGGIFTDNDCMELASHARVLRLRAGDTLCEEGRREQRWYQVVRGELQLRRTAAATAASTSPTASPAAAAGAALPHVVVGRLRARDTFGEASFVLSRPSRYAFVPRLTLLFII